MKLLMITMTLVNVVINEEYSIRSFIDKTTTNIFICYGIENTLLVEELLDLSKEKNIWVNQWNCFEDPIPKTSDGLVILHDVEPHDFKNILARRGIQRGLNTNIWLVILNNSPLEIWEFFDQRNLRISPNARIFFIKKSISFGQEAIQVQGTGSYEIVLQVRYSGLFLGCCIHEFSLFFY